MALPHHVGRALATSHAHPVAAAAAAEGVIRPYFSSRFHQQAAAVAALSGNRGGGGGAYSQQAVRGVAQKQVARERDRGTTKSRILAMFKAAREGHLKLVGLLSRLKAILSCPRTATVTKLVTSQSQSIQY